jgi:hypothetical protein
MARCVFQRTNLTMRFRKKRKRQLAVDCYTGWAPGIQLDLMYYRREVP